MSVHPIGLEDSGRTVIVSHGDRIVLRLPENPTTGFRWAGDIPPFLRLERDETEPGGAPGAAGVRVMELAAASSGRAELRLEYARAWESDAPAERFSVTVEAG